VIQPARIRTAGQADVGAPSKRVAPMDVTQRTVKLSTGEYVGRDDFDALTPSQQAYLMRNGIEAFNSEGTRIAEVAQAAEKEALAFVQRETAKEVKFERENLVKLDNGETVMKQAFDALTPEQQKQLKTLGIDKYNEWVKQEATAKATAAAITAPTTTPSASQPPNTVRLNNGDFVSTESFNRLTPEEQNQLRTLGVDEYNKTVDNAKIEAQQAQQTLTSYAKSTGTGDLMIGPLLPGQERPTIITGNTLLEYLAENKSDPAALATVRAAGYDVTTKDPQTGKSLLDVANQVASDRAKALQQLNTALATGKGAQAVINAMEDAKLYDNTKLNASLKAIGISGAVHWVDNTTGKLLTEQDIAQRIWNTLTPQEKTRVVDVYGADVYKGNYFSEYIKEMSHVAGEAGIAGQLIYGPILAVASPIAKVAVGQPVSATEWAVGGATAVVTIATLGLAPELSGVPGLIARGLTTAAAGTLTGIGIHQTIANWGEMKTPERVAAVALDVVGLVGTALAGISTVQSAKQVINVRQTTAAAVRAGNAYNNMVKTIDAANAEAAQKGLVSAQTVTKVQESIAASRAADTAFLNRFSKIGQASVKTLDKFEKASGYRGLSQAVQDLNTSRKALNAAWDNVAMQTDPVERVRALTEAQIARDRFFNTLNRVGEITTPRTKPIPSVVWDDVIDVTRADLQRVETAYNREATRVQSNPLADKTYLQELRQNADILKSNLQQYEQLRASGEWRGAPAVGAEAEVARAQMRVNYFEKASQREGLLPEEYLAIQDQLEAARAELSRAQRVLSERPLREAEYAPAQDIGKEFVDFTQGKGRYSPEFLEKQRIADEANARLEKSYFEKHGYWPDPSGPRYPSNQPGAAPVERVQATTAGRVATEVKPTETQMSLNLLLEDVLSQPTAAEPRVPVGEVVPKAAATVPTVGVPKGVPLMLVAPVGLVGETEAAEFIADLTPQQFEAMYGDKVKVSPVNAQAAQVIASLSGASVPEVKGATWVSPEEAVQIAAATETGTLVQIGIDAMQRAANQVMIATDNEEALKQAQQTALQTYLETITNPALREHVAAQIKQLTGTETETRVRAITEEETRTKPATETETQTRIKQLTRTEVTPRVKTEVIPEEITPVQPIPIIPIIPPILPSTAVKKRKQGRIYPAGTIVWKQGYMWKVIPPPYNVKKPISTRTAPVGVTVFEGTPQETLTFIGGVVPFVDVSFDLGVVDGYVDVKAKKIIFTGGGLKTEYGERIPGPTTGVSITATPAAKVKAMEREQQQALGLVTHMRRRVPKKTVLKRDRIQTLVQTRS